MKYDINNPRPTPSQERLRELLNYDPFTGIMTWINHPNRTDLNGKVCGAARRGGYLCASVDGHKFTVHRLAYKWMTGEEADIIDHINGITDDNRWRNLRSVTAQRNNFNSALLKNNKSGVAGVFFMKSSSDITQMFVLMAALFIWVHSKLLKKPRLVGRERIKLLGSAKDTGKQHE